MDLPPGAGRRGDRLLAVATALRGEVVLAVILPVIVIGYGLAVTLFARRSDIAAQLSGSEAANAGN